MVVMQFLPCVSIAARLGLRTFISCFLLYVRNNSVTKYEYKVANATRFSMSGYFVELCKLLIFFNPHLIESVVGGTVCCGLHSYVVYET